MNFLKTSPVFSVLIAMCLIFLISTPAISQISKRIKFATTEDIAIAFYKTGGIIPNFEKWIKERDPYRHTQWARRDEVFQQEMSRLQLAYKNYNPKEDFLLIRTFVRLDPSKTVDDEGNETYHLKTVFLEAPDALYFPYDFLGRTHCHLSQKA